jgi:hypothetical protein
LKLLKRAGTESSVTNLKASSLGELFFARKTIFFGISSSIEKINAKVQEIEKAKATIQQLERLGLGVDVSYIVYIEDDVPKKIVLRAKNSSPKDEVFKFVTELSVPALFSNFKE